MKSYPFISEKYTTEVIDVQRAKQWLEMDIDGYDGRDNLINDCIKSAISSVETECNFQLGLSTYTWYTTCLPHIFNDTVYVKEIVSIKADGVLISSDSYMLIRTSERSSAIFWKLTAPKYSASIYEVVFKAGFEEGKVPDDLIQAIRARIGEYYLGERADNVSEKRTLSDKLLTPYLIPYVG